MNSTIKITEAQLQDEFGERVAARLEAGARNLNPDIRARLKSIRLQAVARRKVANVRARTASAVFANGTSAVVLGSGGPGLWGRMATALPLLVLVGGLITIHALQDEDRLSELVEVDSALLTDDLPPSAYTDPGFIEFLRNGLQGGNEVQER
ncbi:DUF3619 family protein [Xylophilus sp. GOD-11R]|uniref:DUF3619 family protein n=1 Tax=Xylophilus sp. GOD-11R TaxID=3089814 RepID=UPI00298CB38A|nr:DUF3619 family protein [Xylophilus sp. GOD-11R]WPB58775.1 DUF3619 family protein [Xylophilus sp. GOD-11R]